MSGDGGGGDAAPVASGRPFDGLTYGTRRGHPVSGEEAFVVHRDDDGRVHLTLRSLTRAAPAAPWRFLLPLLLLAQRCVRRRYLRAPA
ncbi:DUF1990 family protein [Streptomyces viridosporus]|uniref:DUF1990 family protein n=1 Tax=Streptomyces viridosporus T7A TaxID=665577 RepID=A0ABX6AAT5_STRVD|nr:DUF1990 family protein [Streptomyces viridosporus]QEU84054.1 DUF1990 family protein [Streptomyces viridosporus T7A]